MFAALLNGAGVVAGGLLGLLIGKRVPQSLSDALMAALGLVTAALGIGCLTGGNDSLCLIICAVLGTALGEAMHIEAGIERLGCAIERRFEKNGGSGRFAQAFVSCSIIYCVGSMAVMGSIQAGLMGDNSILYTKTVLDFTSGIAFAAALGPGVIFSGFCVIITEGAMALLASAAQPLMPPATVSEMSAVGGLLLLGLAINLLGLRPEKLRVANMLPAVFLPIAYLPLASWLGGLF